ncbi:hypothetical protein ACFQVC_33255 [Streptomyces monticola]|uniref:Large membrane protein n=1 Tax=Streptomyces monticola TaxID=2666263 RepID=A0ABW2JSB0_9ACTN
MAPRRGRRSDAVSSEETREGARRAARRRPGLAVASVAAAVLIAGGGGACFAANASGSGGTTDSGAPSGEGTPPPLELDGSTSGVAPGEPDPGGARYRADGDLPRGPESAPVYRARGVVGSAQVATLAEALGVSGTPRAEGAGWRVGPPQGGPLLRVGKEAPGTWSFQAYTGGTDDCAKGERCGPIGSSGLAGMGPGPVSERAAKDAAAPVLKALGQGDAGLDATQTMGAVRVVNADPKVGGLPTYGWSTGIQVGSDGQLVAGSGQLAKPAKGATYPVISADEALEQLNKGASGDGRVGIAGCARPVPHDDGGEGGDSRADGGGSGGIAPGEPDPGRPQQPCPPDTGTATPGPAPVTVDDAVFGLAVHFERGQQTLVPSWLFQVRPEGAERHFTITHPAVDPKFLAGPSAPGPSAPEPSAPVPTATTDRPGTPRAEPPASPKSRDVPVETYSSDGRTLTLRFWGGECNDYTAAATEKGRDVTVRVTEVPMKKEQVCIAIAKERTEKVTLDAPLGDRTVVGTNGAAVKRK